MAAWLPATALAVTAVAMITRWSREARDAVALARLDVELRQLVADEGWRGLEP